MQEQKVLSSEKFVVFMIEDSVNADRQAMLSLKKFSEFDTEAQAQDWVNNYLTNQRYTRTFLISKVYSNNESKLKM